MKICVRIPQKNFCVYKKIAEIKKNKISAIFSCLFAISVI